MVELIAGLRTETPPVVGMPYGARDDLPAELAIHDTRVPPIAVELMPLPVALKCVTLSPVEVDTLDPSHN